MSTNNIEIHSISKKIVLGKKFSSPEKLRNIQTTGNIFPKLSNFKKNIIFHSPSSKKIELESKNEEEISNLSVKYPDNNILKKKNSLVPKFLIKGKYFTKKSRSLSPVNKNAETTATTKTDQQIYTKYKDIKINCQESEIKLQTLHSQLKEEIKLSKATHSKEKVYLCLQIINTVYL